jgi:glucose/arabinose dehydrogenase
VITSFDEPWALAFLPDGRMLVTEKKGNLFIVTQDGKKSGASGYAGRRLWRPGRPG